MNIQTNFFPAHDHVSSDTSMVQVARTISERLASGQHLTRAHITSLFAEATGSSDADHSWTVAQSNSAVELGALLWLKVHGRIDLDTPFFEVDARLDWLQAALPPRHVRSEEQISLQQFSTPPLLAWLMAKACGSEAGDVVLEPSAGTGMLAIWPHLGGSSLILNEIDPLRREALQTLLPCAAITAHDGELIDQLMDPARLPSAVIMNPPFARSLERGKDSKSAMRHLRSALRLSADGARIAAIMPEGFCARRFAREIGDATVLLDALLANAFRSVGTGISVRMIVIDKAVRDFDPLETECASLSDLNAAIGDLPHRLSVRSASTPIPARSALVVPIRSGTCKPMAPFAATISESAVVETLDYTVLEEPAPLPDQVGIYLPYRPSRIIIAGASAHPTSLVESVAMGSVPAPVPDAKPLVPPGWRQMLSQAQCETLIYAGSAFARDLPGPFTVDKGGTGLEIADNGVAYRQGFFLGDGTGAGKGRQISAVIMDRWLAGECRHIWITKNETLIEDARRDWEALGGLPMDIQSLGSWKLGTPVGIANGILFVTYPTLRSGRMEDTRLGQILAWAGEGFEGVIAFDESHAMANALGSNGTRGKVKGSEQGLAGLLLQNHLPRARVLYASATGASDIANLGYAARLGLWGSETAFATYETFMADIRAGGIAAMELVARDLKAQGLYLARALSFAGVEYKLLEHKLTGAQIRIYDAYADAWAIIHRNLNAALEATRVVDEDSGDTLNRNAKVAALSIFEGTKQRFFAQLLLSMKLPSLLPAIEEALAEDHSVVVQLVSTAEAMLDRRLADLSPQEREALDIDLSPREYVIDYLAQSFPVRLMQVFTDEEGNLRSQAMSDADGNPVLCRSAIQARDALIEQLCALPPIATALDAIIEHFGTDAVAEVTGRSRRLITDRRGQQRLERRTPRANLAEAQSFMDGVKRVLVFSDAGGTGRSYHADLDAHNRQRRVHFLLEPGWRADNAIQGLGRTNRTNQASAPLFRPVTTDVKGERRFISTIARRLDSLGALTRGQRQTGGQNLFDPADNLESDYARDALTRWFYLLYESKLEAIAFGRFVELTGLKLESPDGGLTDNLPSIQRWLNRILALPIAIQNAIFDEYLSLIEARIEAAREAGTLDLGIETVAVESFDIVSDQLLRTDAASGATTHLLTLDIRRRLKPLRFDRLAIMHDIGSAFGQPMRNERSGGVALCVPARRIIADDGSVIERSRLLRPLKNSIWTLEALAESHWEKIDPDSFERFWRAEESQAASELARERVHLATGLLLPVWNRLSSDYVRVTRIVTGDGRALIGREILASDLPDIATAFGLSDVIGPAVGEFASLVMASGKSLEIRSHDRLNVKRSLVNGSQRLELVGFAGERLDWYKAKGCFTEIIRYRTRLFVPVTGASAILDAIVV
ncbi:strawberry notch-like NTP hydrolase domain-containing protein [Novosphingopyxis sp.]|uniref:strawberry notch-like NTP hydrolase domain-containing protein n=1 Tax=Novosphingopyxis sp. TaxID=2709690 RepID=UPI003B5B731A